MLGIISLTSFIKAASLPHLLPEVCVWLGSAWILILGVYLWSVLVKVRKKPLTPLCPGHRLKVFQQELMSSPSPACQFTAAALSDVLATRPYVPSCTPQCCLKGLQGGKQAGAPVFHNGKSQRRKETEERSPAGQTSQRLLCSSSLAGGRKLGWSQSGNLLTPGSNSSQSGIMVLYIYIVFFTAAKWMLGDFKILRSWPSDIL